ncbi:MAG: HAMP domain-containing protein [Deltaproteobacteria bacterium]|nr:HAMP domain-containing protein [Deltaproteobacteria bacterium]
MPYRIRTKLIIAFLVMLAPASAIVAVHHLTNRALYDNISEIVDISQEIAYRDRLQLTLDMLVMPANDYLITADAGLEGEYRGLALEARTALKDLQRHVESRRGVHDEKRGTAKAALFKEVTAGLEEINGKAEFIFSIRRPVGSKAGAAAMKEMDSIARRLIAGPMVEDAARDKKHLLAAIQSSERLWGQSSLIMAASFGAFTAFGVLFAIFYSRFFVRPIKRLHDGAREIAGGNLDCRVDVRTGDEIQQLAGEFNAMGERLKGFYSALEEKVRERTKELECEKDRLTSAFNAMEDGVYIVGRTYDVEYVNPALEREFGPYRDRKCYEYFHNRSEPCPWCPNQKVFAGETVRWEWRSPKNNRTYDLVDTPLRNPDGSVSKLEIFRDITKRKLAEDELRQRLDELERFQKATLQRELRMKDMREKIAALETEMERMKGK